MAKATMTRAMRARLFDDEKPEPRAYEKVQGFRAIRETGERQAARGESSKKKQNAREFSNYLRRLKANKGYNK